MIRLRLDIPPSNQQFNHPEDEILNISRVSTYV